MVAVVGMMKLVKGGLTYDEKRLLNIRAPGCEDRLRDVPGADLHLS